MRKELAAARAENERLRDEVAEMKALLRVSGFDSSWEHTREGLRKIRAVLPGGSFDELVSEVLRFREMKRGFYLSSLLPLHGLQPADLLVVPVQTFYGTANTVVRVLRFPHATFPCAAHVENLFQVGEAARIAVPFGRDQYRVVPAGAGFEETLWLAVSPGNLGKLCSLDEGRGWLRDSWARLEAAVAERFPFCKGQLASVRHRAVQCSAGCLG